MRERIAMAVIFPLLAIITIVVVAGGLGIAFIALNATALEEWGVIIFGTALVVGVPTLAAIAQRRVERK